MCQLDALWGLRNKYSKPTNFLLKPVILNGEKSPITCRRVKTVKIQKGEYKI
jgi:hypothetical protein